MGTAGGEAGTWPPYELRLPVILYSVTFLSSADAICPTRD